MDWVLSNTVSILMKEKGMIWVYLFIILAWVVAPWWQALLTTALLIYAVAA
jgi:hypothetical protein